MNNARSYPATVASPAAFAVDVEEALHSFGPVLLTHGGGQSELTFAPRGDGGMAVTLRSVAAVVDEHQARNLTERLTALFPSKVTKSAPGTMPRKIGFPCWVVGTGKRSSFAVLLYDNMFGLEPRGGPESTFDPDHAMQFVKELAEHMRLVVTDLDRAAQEEKEPPP